MLFEEGSSEAGLQVSSGDGGVDHCVIDGWMVVRVGPGCGVVAGGVVLIGHGVELIEMDLWYVGVRADVDSLGSGEGERYCFVGV